MKKKEMVKKMGRASVAHPCQVCGERAMSHEYSPKGDRHFCAKHTPGDL